jgi:hypothetical protein
LPPHNSSDVVLLSSIEFRVHSSWLDQSPYFLSADPGMKARSGLKNVGWGKVPEPKLTPNVDEIKACATPQPAGQIWRGDQILEAFDQSAVIDFNKLVPRSVRDDLNFCEERVQYARIGGTQSWRVGFTSSALDCAVIKTVHKLRADSEIDAYQTVYGVFEDGGPLYPSAGFKKKTHVQIAVIDTDCILGYFRVRER